MTTLKELFLCWMLLAAMMLVLGGITVAAEPEAMQSDDSATLRAMQWREDIQHLAQTLPTVHVNLYFSISEDEFQSCLASLAQSVDKMSDVEIYVALARLFARIGDSHTMITPKLNLRIVPIQFMQFADGVYPVAWPSKYPSIRGARLVAVGDTPISDVYQVLASLIPHDNRAQLAQAVPGMLNNYDLLVALGIIDDDSPMPYRFETEDGRLESIHLELEPLEGIDFARALDPQTDPVPLYMSRQDWFWQQYLEDDRVLYMVYNVCWDKETEKTFFPDSARLPYLPDFSVFAEEVFATLDAKPVKAMVIDLRLNGGGNSALGTRFIEALAEHPKIKSGVPVYGIIGRNTFSSAIINALDLKRVLKSPLYGEATAGKPNHYGEVRTFELPHSKWTVEYSTKYFRFTAEDSDSLYPDVTMEASFEEFVAGRDPVLERLLEEVRSK